MGSSLSQRLDRLALPLFIFAGLSLAFLFGFIVARYRLPPYPQLTVLEEAARAVWYAYLDDNRFAKPAPRPLAANHPIVSRADPAALQPGVTLVVGYRPEGFAAWLVDETGQQLHRWIIPFSAAFGEKAPHLRWQVADDRIAWHGAQLLSDGTLIVNFQDNNFPYGSGTVALDVNSNVIWALPENTHHDISIDDNGNYWIPSLSVVHPALPGNLHTWQYIDEILHVSHDGRIIEKFPLPKVLSTYPGLMNITYDKKLTIESEDPLHLNNVEPLPEAYASAFPLFSAGDLLLSLRNLNTIVVVDRQTMQVKWSLTGLFVRQHDPDWLPNGHILLFDNLGGATPCQSRVLEIDPVRQTIVRSYDGRPDDCFHSETRGLVQALANGNILITDSHGGRIFEVTADDRIVWDISMSSTTRTSASCCMENGSTALA